LKPDLPDGFSQIILGKHDRQFKRDANGVMVLIHLRAEILPDQGAAKAVFFAVNGNPLGS
jgi:hypothetical protein